MDSDLNHFYRKRRPFRFKAMSLKDSSCEGIIQTSWKKIKGSTLVRNFNQNIVSCQEGLKVWNRNTFGHVWNTLQCSLRELKYAKDFEVLY